MARNPGRTVFIGNLDEKVSERVLYEILIQAGHVVDLHVPIDKESNSRKGYAFAEYETEEIAQYTVKLFSGLVRINGKTLKFMIAGQDKPSSNGNNSAMLNPVPSSSNGNNPVMPKLNPIPLPKQTQIMRCSDMPVSRTPAYPVVNGRIGSYGFSPTPYSYGFHPQVLSGGPVHSHGQVTNSTYDYNRQECGSVLNIAHRGLVTNSTYDYNRQEFGSVLNIAHGGPIMNAFAHGAANQPIIYPS